MKYFVIFPILFILIGFSFASAQYQGDIKSYHLPVHVESESYSIVTQSIMTKFTKTLYDEPAKALIFSISSDEELIDTMAITMNNQTFLKLFPNVESEDPNDVFVLVNGEEIAYKAVTNLDIFSWVFMVPPKSTEIEIIGSPFYDSQQFFKPKLLINVDNFIQIYSPLKQDHLDISFDKIQCKQNLVLIQKYDGSPACVTESTKQKLIERGWTTGNSYDYSQISDDVIGSDKGNQTITWNLEEYVVPITLNNIVLDYVRAEYNNQKILLYITMENKSKTGLVEFTLPKQAASLIFDNQTCTIFQDNKIEEFLLQVNQKIVGRFNAEYAITDNSKEDNDIILSITTPSDSGVVEIFSMCSSSLPPISHD